MNISSDAAKGEYVHGFESYDVLHKKHKGKENAVFKKLLMKRIKSMKKNGFCIDYLCQGSKNAQFNIDEILSMPSMEGKFKVLKEWAKWDGTKHKFVWFDPTDWNFTYVCFDNLVEVSKTSASLIYANSFWGILLVNDKQKMTALVQWDDFWNCLKVSYYNIYDGGNSLTVLLPPEYRLLCNKGVIVDSFDEFAEIHRSLMWCQLDEEEEKIDALKEEIKLRKKKMNDIKLTYNKDFMCLKKLV